MAAIILLRTHRFAAAEAGFAARLRRESGHDVVILADETSATLATPGFDKIPWNRQALRRLGLHTPADAAWRCGDYGFYLARAAMPHIDHFWLVEPDVRAAVADYAELFTAFRATGADFLAAGIAPAERAHFWQPTMRWRTDAVYRCHFAFCRLSAEGADLCLQERRRLRTSPLARLMWPNDETLVATTLMRLGRQVHDVNDFGRIWWTDASFGFRQVIRGEAFDRLRPDGLLYHPVLWGEDADRKATRVARGITRSEYIRLKALRAFNRFAGPQRRTA